MKKITIDEIIENKICSLIKLILTKIIKVDKRYNYISFIDLEEVKRLKNEYGIGGLIIDVDDTIRKELKIVPECNQEWIKFIKEELKICIISNGSDIKIKNFTDENNIPYIQFANKPLKKSFMKAVDIMGLNPENILVVGDSMYADILGGKRLGMNTALIDDVEK